MFTQTDDIVIWRHVRQARTDLATYLETLSEEQWNQDSLCDGWMVRDVIAHLLLEYHYSAVTSWRDFIRSGFSVNRFMKQTAVQLGSTPTSELLQQFRAMVDEQRKPASVSVMNVLVDVLVHEQDIRVPLGHSKARDTAPLRLVFSHWEPGVYNFGEKITGLSARLKGLRFVITDLGIVKGNGAEVIGTAQDILLAATGRNISIDRLGGEGAAILSSRLH